MTTTIANLSVADQIRDGKRFDAALAILDDTTAMTNGFELNAENPTPRYLAVELSDGIPVWAHEVDSPSAAVAALRASETEFTSANLHDLDTNLVYDVDYQVAGFACISDDHQDKYLSVADHSPALAAAVRALIADIREIEGYWTEGTDDLIGEVERILNAEVSK